MTTLIPDRESALQTGYEASDWAQMVPYENFEAYFSTWECYAVVRHETCIGACFFQPETCEMHFSILPEWRRRWLGKDLLKRLLSMPLIRTKIHNCTAYDGSDYDFMYDILSRCGFVEQDGYMVRVNDGH